MALSESSERDGFHITKKVFIKPSNTTLLDLVTKRKITICNLLLITAYRCEISSGCWTIDMTMYVLMEQGLIRERRKNPRTVKEEPRHSPFRKL